jgi:hypothetical protein
LSGEVLTPTEINTRIAQINKDLPTAQKKHQNCSGQNPEILPLAKLAAALRLSWPVYIQDSRTVCEVKQTHIYKVRPRKDKRGVDLISDALPFGRL